MNQRVPTRRGLLIALVSLVVVMVPHIPALSADFTYDDQEFVQHNASIRGLGVALRSFDAPFPPEQPERGLYRPLTALSYAVDHAIWGLDPLGFHLSNLLYYLLTLLVIYVVACRLLRSEPAALATAVLFGAHPVHCEAVDSVAGRSELLALLFALLALELFCRWRARRTAETGAAGRAWWLLALSVLAYAASALCKETGVMLPAALGLYLWLYPGEAGGQRPSLVRRLMPLLPFAAAALLYLGLRYHALDGTLGPTSTVLGDRSVGERVLTVGTVFAEYARLLVAPTELQVDVYYEHIVGSQRGVTASAVGGLALLGLALAGLTSLLRRSADRAHNETGSTAAAAFGIGWLLIFLFPVMHVIPVGTVMAERLLYAPSLGFILLVVAGAQALAARGQAAGRQRSSRRWLAPAVVLALVGLMGVRTWLRATDWQGLVPLWGAVLPHARDDHRVYNNLALGYRRRGDHNRAAALLRRSLELRWHPYTANNLATVYVAAGRLDTAAKLLRQLLERAPRDPLGWNNLGVVEQRRGRLKQAVVCYRRALALNPNDAKVRENLDRLKRRLSGRQGEP